MARRTPSFRLISRFKYLNAIIKRGVSISAKTNTHSTMSVVVEYVVMRCSIIQLIVLLSLWGKCTYQHWPKRSQNMVKAGPRQDLGIWPRLGRVCSARVDAYKRVSTRVFSIMKFCIRITFWDFYARVVHMIRNTYKQVIQKLYPDIHNPNFYSMAHFMMKSDNLPQIWPSQKRFFLKNTFSWQQNC